jgi:hypothetical protein
MIDFAACRFRKQAGHELAAREEDGPRPKNSPASRCAQHARGVWAVVCKRHKTGGVIATPCGDTAQRSTAVCGFLS